MNNKISTAVASLTLLFCGALSAAVPGKQQEVNQYGGAVYQGGAKLDLVSALVQAGTALASGLVNAGIAPDDTTFWSGYYYDHLFGHALNKELVSDVDAKYNPYFTRNLYMITNQAMYDISQQVHTHNIRLAKLH